MPRMLRRFFVLMIMSISIVSLTFGGEIPLSLSHLTSLKWNFDLNGKKVAAWWVYSTPSATDPEKYVNIEAQNEGAVCVDDAARAVVLYLQLYEKTNNLSFLAEAKGGLNFLMVMENEDGESYNFVFPNGQINKYGSTSVKSVSWWTVRSFWALSMGARVFKKEDPTYSSELISHALLAFKSINSSLNDDLVLGYADLSSVYLLGLTNLYEVYPSNEIEKAAQTIAEGILNTQLKDTNGFMNGAFFTSKTLYYWNGWGAREVQALAFAGMVFKVNKWTESAEYAALNFYPKLILSLGPIYSANGSITEYLQISYADEVIVSGLTELYLSTKKQVYANMAYLAASWLFYNNHLGELMYTSDGKGYDGLEEYFRNIDSGAESTICADLILSDLEKLPQNYVSSFLQAKRIDENGIKIIDISKMNTSFGGVGIVNDNSVGNGTYATFSPYAVALNSINLNESGTYDVYISYYNPSVDGNVNLYIDNTKYSLKLETNQNFKIHKVLSAYLLKGKHDITIEYLNNGSSTIDLAQIIIVPEIIYQTIFNGKTYLTTIDNTSDESTNLDFITTNGTITNFYSFPLRENAQTEVSHEHVNGESIVFIQWITNKVIQKKSNQSAIFESKINIAKIFDNFLMLNLSNIFNDSGIVSVNSNIPANFDNPSGITGAAYPLEFLRNKIKNGILWVNVDNLSVPFYLGEILSNTSDNIRLKGQSISIESTRISKIFLLGASDHGNYQRNLKIYYSDGSTQEIPIEFSDWFSGPLPNEIVAFEFPYGLSSTMQRMEGHPKMYIQAIETNDSKKIIELEFPNQMTMHIFAITLMK
ncbi:MAG: hypothetical protein M1542_08875 [Thermotogae bacterium]|nr:hypothetical protein [Thermotogota bacterium]